MRPSSISFVERELRDLAAQRVERREHDRLRRVVDDEVDARHVLERPDVASLPSDDAALHVVGGELDERDGRLGRVARGDPLERVRDEVPGAAFRLAAGLLVELAHTPREVVADEIFGALAGGGAWRPPTVIPEMRSSSATCWSFVCLSSSWSCRRCVSRSNIPCSRRAISTSFASTSSSLASTRSSILRICARRVLDLLLDAPRGAGSLCSRASICASRLSVSASSAGLGEDRVLVALGARPARHLPGAERERARRGADHEPDQDANDNEHDGSRLSTCAEAPGIRSKGAALRSRSVRRPYVRACVVLLGRVASWSLRLVLEVLW